MTTSEIDLFLVAKQNERNAWLFFVAGALGITTGIVITVVLGGTTSSFVYCGFGFILGFVAAFGALRSGSKTNLLQIIENQINRDPEALSYIAMLRKKAEQAIPADRGERRRSR
jgi:hypothetical protein